MYNYNKERQKLIDTHLETYGYLFCHRCKKNSCGFKFEIHHIIYRSEAPKHENLHNTKNLIILGTDCHKWYHESKSRRDHLVKSRGLNKLFTFLPK